jgi:hypothetical protein
MQQLLQLVDPQGVVVATVSPSSREAGRWAYSSLEDGVMTEQVVDEDVDDLVLLAHNVARAHHVPLQVTRLAA